MENGTGRGYSMPMSVNPRKRWMAVGVLTVLAGWLIFQIVTVSESVPVFGVILGFAAAFWLGQLYAALAKVHFVPEGIALTLFGLTLRRWPSEEVRSLCGMRFVTKFGSRGDAAIELTSDYIAVCRRSREDVIRQGAGKYLATCGALGLLRLINRDADVFWLEWDPERLKALQSLYPNAQWLDCTRELVFDGELYEEPRKPWEF